MAEAQPPQRRGRLLKVAGIVAAAVIGVAALALIGVNAYVRVAYAPFYEAATDEFPLPGLDAGFVPQDLDYLDEAGAWLFSGYQAKDGPSPLYRRDADGTVARLTVALPDGSSYQGHGSAVTSTDDYVLLAQEGGYLVLDAREVAAAPDGAALQPVGSVEMDFSPAFMNVEDGTLYAGDFYFPGDYETPAHHRIVTPDGTENPAVIYAYPASDAGRFGFAERAERVYSIPAMVQGVAVTADGQMVLSCSYGLRSSHLLAFDLGRTTVDGAFVADGATVPLYALDSRSLAADLKAPPMTEGIESHDGLVYVSEESACSKYLFGRLYGAGVVYALPL